MWWKCDLSLSPSHPISLSLTQSSSLSPLLSPSFTLCFSLMFRTLLLVSLQVSSLFSHLPHSQLAPSVPRIAMEETAFALSPFATQQMDSARRNRVIVMMGIRARLMSVTPPLLVRLPCSLSSFPFFLSSPCCRDLLLPSCSPHSQPLTPALTVPSAQLTSARRNVARSSMVSPTASVMRFALILTCVRSLPVIPPLEVPFVFSLPLLPLDLSIPFNSLPSSFFSFFFLHPSPPPPRSLIPGCTFTDKKCPAGDLCTSSVCVSGSCFPVEKDCDDNDPCTIDSCDPNSGTSLLLLCSYSRLPPPLPHIFFPSSPLSTVSIAVNYTSPSPTPPQPSLLSVLSQSKAVSTLLAAVPASLSPLLTSVSNAPASTASPPPPRAARRRKRVASSSLATVILSLVARRDSNASLKVAVLLLPGSHSFPPLPPSPSPLTRSENGQCVSTPIDCNDGNPCTEDTCSPGTLYCSLSSISFLSFLALSYPFLPSSQDGDCVNTSLDNKCQKAVPNLANNTCDIIKTICDDFDVCTIDTCDPDVGCTSSSLPPSLHSPPPPPTFFSLSSSLQVSTLLMRY